MNTIEISKLIPHPRNKEFFDDIHGDKWDDFKKSIIRRGVVEPIVITDDFVIISGHQRVYACKELNILTIPCKITTYPDCDSQTGNPKEDLMLEDLICTNIMQRGIANANGMKMAKCIKELERIYGVRQGSAGGNGNNQYTAKELEAQIAPQATQKDLADLMGISVDQLKRYKSLINLVPDIQELVEKDKVKPSVAYNILTKLTKEDQQVLFNQLGEKLGKKPAKEIEKHLEMNRTQTQKSTPQKEVVANNKFDEEPSSLENDLNVKEKEYNNLLKEKKLLEDKIARQDKQIKDADEFKAKIESLHTPMDDVGRQIDSAVSLSALYVEIEHFLKTQLAPIRYSRAIMERKDSEVAMENLRSIIEVVKEWAYEIEGLIPNNQKKYINVEVIND